MRLLEQRQIVVRDCLVGIALESGFAGPVVVMGTGGQEPGTFNREAQKTAALLEIGPFDLLEEANHRRVKGRAWRRAAFLLRKFYGPNRVEMHNKNRGQFP